MLVLLLAATMVASTPFEPVRCHRERPVDEQPVILAELVYGGGVLLPGDIPSAQHLVETARLHHDVVAVALKREIAVPVGSTRPVDLLVAIPGSRLGLGWTGTIKAGDLVIWQCAAGLAAEEIRVLSGRFEVAGHHGAFTTRLVSIVVRSLPYPQAFDGLSDLSWTVWELERFDGGIGSALPYEALYLSLRLSTRAGLFSDGFESGSTDAWSTTWGAS